MLLATCDPNISDNMADPYFFLDTVSIANSRRLHLY